MPSTCNISFIYFLDIISKNRVYGLGLFRSEVFWSNCFFWNDQNNYHCHLNNFQKIKKVAFLKWYFTSSFHEYRRTCLIKNCLDILQIHECKKKTKKTKAFLPPQLHNIWSCIGKTTYTRSRLQTDPIVISQCIKWTQAIKKW